MKLFANGLASLISGDKTYTPDDAGMFDVPPECADTAISHGATDPRAAAPAPVSPTPDTGDLMRRLVAVESANASLVNRVAALEAANTAPAGKKG